MSAYTIVVSFVDTFILFIFNELIRNSYWIELFLKNSIVRGLMLNAFDKIYRSFKAYFSTILMSKFGINDKNHAPDNPTGPAPTIKIDFFFILIILPTILKFKSKFNTTK